MNLDQPTVEITVQMATKTDKVNSKGEALWQCGSLMVTEATLTKMFEESDANLQVKYNKSKNTIWVSYKEPDIRNTIKRHILLFGGALLSYEVAENGSI